VLQRRHGLALLRRIWLSARDLDFVSQQNTLANIAWLVPRDLGGRISGNGYNVGRRVGKDLRWCH
jgi:hypothetical protein